MNFGNQKDHRLADGRYVFYRWDEEAKKEIPLYIVPGQDGVTEEHILLLDELRRETQENEWKANQLRSYQSEPIEDDEGHTADAIEQLPDPQGDVWQQLFPDAEDENAQALRVQEALSKLTPAQIDLFYDLFGLMKQMTEVARDSHRSKQAVFNARAKILKRLTKLLAETNNTTGG